jgi:hypothetical protein
MKKLETKFGTMYYEKAHKKEPFEYVLLDSDKNWFRNIYDKSELEELKVDYGSFGEMAEQLFGWCCYAKGTKKDLLEVINDVFEDYNSRYPKSYEQMNLEDLEGNEYYNRIGDYHLFFME